MPTDGRTPDLVSLTNKIWLFLDDIISFFTRWSRSVRNALVSNNLSFAFHIALLELHSSSQSIFRPILNTHLQLEVLLKDK